MLTNIIIHVSCASFCTEEEGVQASIGQVLVDKQLLLFLQADAVKLREVDVPKLGDQQQLVLQLLQALR